jgi:hypothetical protein
MSKRVLVALIAIIPFVAQLVVIPWVNHIQPLVLGIPFLHVWLFVWMLLTPVFTLAIHRILNPSAEE